MHTTGTPTLLQWKTSLQIRGNHLLWRVQGLMCRELFALAEKSQKQQPKPAGQGRFQQWYFFMVAAFWMYFRSALMSTLQMHI